MRAIEKLKFLGASEAQTAETEAQTAAAKQGWDALGNGSSTAQTGDCYLPEVEGKVPLLPIAGALKVSPELAISVRADIQYEPCLQTKDGDWVSIGKGIQQSFAVQRIFVRCTTKEAANERLACVALLVGLDKFLASNPDGGMWEFKGAHFKVRKIKTKEPQKEVEADIEL